MNIIKTGALLLCLLSSLAQAETSLFGLTLGKSTRQETEQTYTLQHKNTASGLPDSWNYYRVSGEQFNEAQLKHATLYFDNTQTLGRINFTFPSSLEKYKTLEEQLSRQYPRIKMAPSYRSHYASIKPSFKMTPPMYYWNTAITAPTCPLQT